MNSQKCCHIFSQYCYFCEVITMKQLLLILPFFLSCLFNDGRISDAGQCAEYTSAIVETSEQNPSDSNPDYNAQALLPVQSARISGENTNVTPSIRSTSSGRRTQVSQKYPFRIVKAGKVIDRNSFYIFLTELLQFQTGSHSTRRYIHTICCLLI